MSIPSGPGLKLIPTLLLCGPTLIMGGTLSINELSEPPDAIVSQSSSNSYTRSFHNDSNNGKTTRGNSFMVPSTGDQRIGYQISGLTLKKEGNQSFSSGDTLNLWVFTWNPPDNGLDTSTWALGDGFDPSNGNSDPVSGTGMELRLVDTFDLSGLTLTDESFFTFDLSDSPLFMGENTAFGFLVGYTDGGGTGSSYFQYKQGTSNGHVPGVQIRTQGKPSVNSVAPSSWDVTFYVRGSVLDSSTDSDGDELSDAWEYLNFQNLDQSGSGNADSDGADNESEETAGTDPNQADTDHDGLDDDVEIAGPTDPLDPDSDDDLLPDGVESGSGTYTSPSDTGTNPMLADTDADKIPDGTEIKLGGDPFDETHKPAEQPNIIFIMIDDADVREIGVYGQKSIQTPRVDTMASQGMLFTDYYTASPVCHSCRSCLMTGQDSRRSQDRFNNGDGTGYQVPLAAERVTIGEVLQQAGYTTGCVGKWGMGGPTTTGAPWNQGFDFFCGYLGQVQAHKPYPKYLWKNDKKIYFNQALATSEGGTLYLPGANNNNASPRDWHQATGNVASHDVVFAEGLQFIEDNADKPFFLYCAWTPPHAFNYAAATVDALTDADGLVYDSTDHSQTLIGKLYPDAPFGSSATTPGFPDFLPHTYASMLSGADRDAGRIMDKLVELEIDDKTLVIFCSDNGEAGATFLAAEHLKAGFSDLRGEKKDTYEGGIRAPFVAWWPGTIPPASTSGVIGTFADLLPTFADMAGVSTPPQITGRSILPVLHGGSENDLQPRDYHYWSFREHSNGLFRRWRTVRKGDWKVVRDRVNDGSPPTYELFNLATDLYETTDLSTVEPAILSKLIPLVEGTHEVSDSRYFRADDEFYSQSNLTASAYEIGIPDGSGAANGYSLSPNGTGTAFNYLPFEGGLNESASFTWTLQLPSTGAASFLLGSTNDPALCLAVRIDPSTLELEVRNNEILAASTTLAAEDLPGKRAECLLHLDPLSGAGKVTIGSTTLPIALDTNIGPLSFWGYEIETTTVQVSRPRWHLGAADSGKVELKDGTGALDGVYLLPSAPGMSVTTEFSIDLVNWFDNPPGLNDSRSIDSQGQIRGSWHLPMDSLLPRNNAQLFLRARSE